jgi:cytochrome c oxidase cbb3-type subunit 3
MTTPCWLGLLLLIPTTALAQTPDGKALYETNCKMCHGPSGVPVKAMQQAMPGIATFDSAFLKTHSEDSVVKVMTHGGKLMKSFKDRLSPAQMVAVAKYVRELAQNNKGRASG